MCLQRQLGGEGVKTNNLIVLKKKVISKPVLNVFWAGRDGPRGGLREGVGMGCWQEKLMLWEAAGGGWGWKEGVGEETGNTRGLGLEETDV